MKVTKFVYPLIIATAVCLGCGGSGKSDPNPFAGTWYPTLSSGTLHIQDSGDFSMDIASSIGGTDKYSGHVAKNGNLTARMHNTGYPDIVFDVNGDLTRISSTRINVTLTVVYQGNSTTVSEDFTNGRSESGSNSANNGLKNIRETILK